MFFCGNTQNNEYIIGLRLKDVKSLKLFHYQNIHSKTKSSPFQVVIIGNLDSLKMFNVLG